MENLSPQEYPNAISFDNVCIKHLKSTCKWTKFLSLLGFIFITFSVITVGLFATQHGNILAILPLSLIVLVYFFPIYYLWQFSMHSKLAIESNSAESLGKAMMFLKRHYMFMGILVIIVITLYLFSALGLFFGVKYPSFLNK